MCLESVKDSEAIVYCDGGSSDKTIEIAKKYKANIIVNAYDQEDKTMNGKQRNFYLRAIKNNYPDYWCLVLDADEVVEDLSKIKKLIKIGKKGVYSVKMRHFIGDLGHEDSTVNEHFVLNRLFYVPSADKYPEVEHPVLIPKKEYQETFWAKSTTIWHLAYIPNMWDIKKRYENHMKKSNMHTPEFLKQWYKAHLFGRYPKRQFNIIEIPEIILKEFGLSKDELYFENRNLELKHFIDAIHWKEFFKPKRAIEWGCGKGPRVFCLNNVGIQTTGYELSDYAVKHSIDKNVVQGDIANSIHENRADLVIAYDLLEHLSYEKLDKAIDQLVKDTEDYILISVPVIGDPNLEADPTHKIKEDRDWWIEKFLNKNLEYVETPSHFLFKNQIMIFRRKK